MVRVGIVGATGYTALELLRILLRHPQVSVTRATSRGDAGQSVDAIHPGLRGRIDLTLSDFSLEDFIQQVDCAFCCLPHAAASPIVKQLVDNGIRVIDFSADYRLNDLASFEATYAADHADPERLGRVPYGLPELFGETIRNSDLVANPGCFPTSVILPLTPLIQAHLVEANDIIVDSKTGVTGGGRTPKLPFHFPECNESVAAYGVGTHRHRPEMEVIVERFAGIRPHIVFTPHLMPMDRGILSTIYLRPRAGIDIEEVFDCWTQFYRVAPFIRVSRAHPTTKDVAFTNFCDLSAARSGDRLVVISAIDNLVKGASGAAVQNLNTMYGFAETEALL